MFANISYTKSPLHFTTAADAPNIAPQFRKSFTVCGSGKSVLYVAALGYGYFWLNGVPVSDDKFISATSDYNKTVWYHKYDVTALVRSGKNTLAVWCGNGFYNESFKTPWDHDKATWRDYPKFILDLQTDGVSVLTSGDGWKCRTHSAIISNNLRSGEHFDSRLYDPAWTLPDYDTTEWEDAVVDTTPPKGILRECKCEPIRECAAVNTVSYVKTGEKQYLYDMGQNLSGYIRLTVKAEVYDDITIRYCEEINADNTFRYNGMEHFYPETPFQTDEFIANGKEFTWSPRFAYHGFRYISLDGVTDPDKLTVSAVFVHQDIEPDGDFNSSSQFLNDLYRIGRMAVYSNLFYMPTDCPTREKLGWANDAQSSTEQLLINFKVANFLKKWLVDIRDSMNDEGAIPGIIPSSGWGFDWGNGPVSEGIIFEVPYKLWKYTGDEEPLTSSLPWFKRYFAFLRSRENADGLLEYGLDDWAPPEKSMVPVGFINLVLTIKFLRIAIKAAELAAAFPDMTTFKTELTKKEQLFKTLYMNSDGTCKIDEQTSVSLAIYYDLYTDLEPLKQQLKRAVEARDFHHNCGMVGLRRLYYALDKCGLSDYAYKIVTAKGTPSYSVWLDGGATTAWEHWLDDWSHNHHMYTDYMMWLIKTPGGITYSHKRAVIDPYFADDLTWCTVQTHGVKVDWRRTATGTIRVTIVIPAGVTGSYANRELTPGVYYIDAGDGGCGDAGDARTRGMRSL
jgi:alpha-L-rhamnosidase